ncbi:hypothetical protein HQ571_00695 [Candidatus Kuenenbacteria bacterium]|nr:hypothetical protein [Candidatus Kuenenbacteria bacterium]
MAERKLGTIGVQVREMHPNRTLEIRMLPPAKDGKLRFTLEHVSREFYKIGSSFRDFTVCEGKTINEIAAFLRGALLSIEVMFDQHAVGKALKAMIEQGLVYPREER